MIHVIDKLHLNDFVEVHIPRPKDLYARFGKRVSNTNFDSSDDIVPQYMSKMDSLEELAAYDAMMQSEKQSAAQQETVSVSEPQNDNPDE